MYALCAQVVNGARVHLGKQGIRAEDRMAVEAVVDAWGIE